MTVNIRIMIRMSVKFMLSAESRTLRLFDTSLLHDYTSDSDDWHQHNARMTLDDVSGSGSFSK